MTLWLWGHGGGQGTQRVLAQLDTSPVCGTNLDAGMGQGWECSLARGDTGQTLVTPPAPTSHPSTCPHSQHPHGDTAGVTEGTGATSCRCSPRVGRLEDMSPPAITPGHSAPPLPSVFCSACPCHSVPSVPSNPSHPCSYPLCSHPTPVPYISIPIPLSPPLSSRPHPSPFCPHLCHPGTAPSRCPAQRWQRPQQPFPGCFP